MIAASAKVMRHLFTVVAYSPNSPIRNKRETGVVTCIVTLSLIIGGGGVDGTVWNSVEAMVKGLSVDLDH